jgi:hypothetical protein
VELADLEGQTAAVRDKLWQFKHHADQISDLETDEQRQLAVQKQALLANIPPRGEKWRWHREMTAINKRLSELAASQAELSRKELEQLAKQERDQRVLQSRELSFCLFPLETVSRQLAELAER